VAVTKPAQRHTKKKQKVQTQKNQILNSNIAGKNNIKEILVQNPYTVAKHRYVYVKCCRLAHSLF
jgi:hypothetical protein